MVLKVNSNSLADYTHPVCKANQAQRTGMVEILSNKTIFFLIFTTFNLPKLSFDTLTVVFKRASRKKPRGFVVRKVVRGGCGLVGIAQSRCGRKSYVCLS